MYPVCTCRDPISLILGTRFSLILGTRIGSLKHLKNTLRLTVFHKRVLRAAAVKCVRDISQLGYIVSACSKTSHSEQWTDPQVFRLRDKRFAADLMTSD